MTKGWFRSLLDRIANERTPLNTPLPPAPPEPKRRKPLKVSDRAVAASRMKPAKAAARVSLATAVKLAQPPRGVVPDGSGLAMDALPALTPEVMAIAAPFYDTDLVFPGYPVLALMSQRVEYRLVVGAYSREMTRSWIEFTGDDKEEDIAKIDAEFKRLRIRELVGDMIDDDGFFGRGHIYIDMGKKDSDGLPLPRDKATVGVGSIKGIRRIDPMWCYPKVTNANDPRDAQFYRPEQWYINGQTVHTDRLLTLITNPVPDMIRPLYMYGGLSRTQQIKPYVDNWLRDRQSISDAVNSYAVWVMKTNMEAFLTDGDEDPDAMDQVTRRAEVFNNLRSNRGVAFADLTEEDIVIREQSLGTLDALQQQSKEHIGSFAGVPLVVLYGETPTGLSGAVDGPLRIWYDRVMAEQERDLRPIVQPLFELAQLNVLGKIDPAIGFRFVPLYQLDEVQQATVRKTNADTDGVLIMNGVLAPDDARERLAKEEKSPYRGIKLSEPPPPEDEGGEGNKNDEKDRDAA